jgi:hypothetical protein
MKKQGNMNPGYPDEAIFFRDECIKFRGVASVEQSDMRVPPDPSRSKAGLD